MAASQGQKIAQWIFDIFLDRIIFVTPFPIYESTFYKRNIYFGS